MELDPHEIGEICKTLYIRAVKLLPRDVKEGFAELQRRETDATGRAILGTMVENIAVAERTRNLLCQDTGIPIYNVTIGKNVDFRRRGAEGSGPARLRTRDARASAALLGRASDHAPE